MKHLFIPYELAVIAKEKGFDESCLGYYTPVKDWIMTGNKWNPEPHFHGPNWPSADCKFYFKYIPNSFGDRDCNIKNSQFTKAIQNIAVPLYQQIIDWFREKNGIDIFAKKEWVNGNMLGYCGYIEDPDGVSETKEFKTYYEALTKAIEEAFKLI